MIRKAAAFNSSKKVELKKTNEFQTNFFFPLPNFFFNLRHRYSEVSGGTHVAMELEFVKRAFAEARSLVRRSSHTLITLNSSSFPLARPMPDRMYIACRTSVKPWS